MEYEIKRFNIWSVIKIIFIIFLIIGFLISSFYVVILLLIQTFVGSIGLGGFENELMAISGVAGIFIVLFFTIFYAVFVSVFCALILGLYNIIAGSLGGIKFTIDREISETSEIKISPEQT